MNFSRRVSPSLTNHIKGVFLALHNRRNVKKLSLLPIHLNGCSCGKNDMITHGVCQIIRDDLRVFAFGEELVFFIQSLMRINITIVTLSSLHTIWKSIMDDSLRIFLYRLFMEWKLHDFVILLFTKVRTISPLSEVMDYF